MAHPSETFQPRDALYNTAITTLQTTAAGAILAGVQNTLRKENVGAMGIFTRSGGIIALYAGAGFTYQFTLDVASNLRQKEDSYTHAMAGFVSGSCLGVFRRSLPFMLGSGATLAAIMAAFEYTRGLHGAGSQADDDGEVERREQLKKLRRRPLSETIEQLGEGRGIYAPGYEERRRQRLLAKYGIDVKAAQESA